MAASQQQQTEIPGTETPKLKAMDVIGWINSIREDVVGFLKAWRHYLLNRLEPMTQEERVLLERAERLRKRIEGE